MKHLLISFAILLIACTPEPEKINEVKTSNEKEVKKAEPGKKLVRDSVELDSGIKITWTKNGTGDNLETGDVIGLDYKVYLENGKLVESNEKMKKPFPFMVGFGMQTKGWDIALKELKVGDEVSVFVPSELARGKKGIEGLVPPNSNNILQLKVVNKLPFEEDKEGNKVWMLEQSKLHKTLFNDKNTVSFHAMASTVSNPFYINTYRKGTPFEFKMKDAGVVPGLKQSLLGKKRADRMYVLIPAKNAYGSEGLKGLVQPNEDLFYNVYIMDVF